MTMARLKILVVLILFCAVKCFAVSKDKLKDFVDYIKKSSGKCPVKKKHICSEHSTSDNAWEENDNFEGDLILNTLQRRLIIQSVAGCGVTLNGLRDVSKRWPNNEVIYKLKVDQFSDDQVQAILNAMDEIANLSCITFRPQESSDRNAVVIEGKHLGCSSSVGYQGGLQILNLRYTHPPGRGCFRHGTILHELLHTLGFYHMQSNFNRDEYVTINWDNIKNTTRFNFEKYNSSIVSTFGEEYDYNSVLHYDSKAFSVNGKPTIVPKKIGVSIGQRKAMSSKDLRKLNRMYQCEPYESENEQSVENVTETENVTKTTTTTATAEVLKLCKKNKKKRKKMRRRRRNFSKIKF